MMDIRAVITLADLDLLTFLINEYRFQSEAIEKKGGLAGHSRKMERDLITLIIKLGGRAP